MAGIEDMKVNVEIKADVLKSPELTKLMELLNETNRLLQEIKIEVVHTGNLTDHPSV